MANRRLSIRVPFRKRVRYGLSNPNSSGYALNISKNGMAIESHRTFPVRSKIMIHIHIGGNTIEDGRMEEVVLVEGIISWVSHTLPGIPTKMGIKFVSKFDEINRIYQDKAGQYQLK
jgi:hypothetical protein